MKILLLGANGQVGHALRAKLAPLGTLIACTRTDVNLEDTDALCQTLREVAPDLIVNAAAYTDVEGAETDQERAEKINNLAPKVIAQEAQRLGACLVHYSTDYVFDGTKEAPYLETDDTSPLNAYGATKLRGEQAIEAQAEKYIILRTSWVYSTHGKNFPKTMLSVGQEHTHLKVIDDQIGAPTSAPCIAKTTVHILKHLIAHPDAPVSGLYHLTTTGEASWYTYAQFLLEQAALLGVPLRITPEHITPVPSDQFPTKAKRPKNSQLCCRKLEETFHLKLPTWRSELLTFLRAYAEQTLEQTMTPFQHTNSRESYAEKT